MNETKVQTHFVLKFIRKDNDLYRFPKIKMNLLQYTCLGFLSEPDCLLAVCPLIFKDEALCENAEFIHEDGYIYDEQEIVIEDQPASQGEEKEESPMDEIKIDPVSTLPTAHLETSPAILNTSA